MSATKRVVGWIVGLLAVPLSLRLYARERELARRLADLTGIPSRELRVRIHGLCDGSVVPVVGIHRCLTPEESKRLYQALERMDSVKLTSCIPSSESWN